MSKKQKKILVRILVSAALALALRVLKAPAWVWLAPYFLIGYDILLKAFHGIRSGEIFDENFLMAVATVGAVALGNMEEAVAVMVFDQTGELFQSVAVGKSRKSISDLMDIRPDSACLVTAEGEKTVDPDEVEVGSVIVVRPGERVPIDGRVVEGTSSLNTAALTGESAPRDVAAGDEVLSGCVNMTGLLRVQTT